MTDQPTPEEMLETPSGLPLDGAQVVITGSTFGFNNDYAANVPVWKAEFTMEDGNSQEQIFSTGAGEPTRDGSAIEIDKRFSGSSNYGRIISQARNLIGTDSEVLEVLGDVREAEGWMGTEWTLGIEKVARTNPRTGDKKDSFVVNLVEYHGKNEEVEEAKPAKKTAAKKTTAAKKATKTTAKKSTAKKASLADEDPELWEELLELAGEYEDHDEFMEAAFELDSVTESTLAQNAVYKMGPGSIWHAREGEE